MTKLFRYPLVLCLLVGSRLHAQPPARPVGPIDSVVLVRTSVPGWPCLNCPPERVAIRRGDRVSTASLAQIRAKADSIGFYTLPADVMGASFCRIVRSDGLLATLSIYHADGRWSVGGYRHCSAPSSEQAGLLAMEALVDSLVIRPQRRPPESR
jgi:hypothetical protein